MIDSILESLRKRTDIQGWTVRHEINRETQLYVTRREVESSRSVNREQFVVDVLRTSPGPDGKLTSGGGRITLLPGDDIEKALSEAALMATLVHNPPYSLAQPTSIPQVPLLDPALDRDAPAALEALYADLRQAADRHPEVRLTAAEFFGVISNVHLLNSNGIDLEQTLGQCAAEWVFISRNSDHEMESFIELTRRRLKDLDIDCEVGRRARYAVDMLSAGSPNNYKGPVVLREGTLATFLNGGTLHTLSSADIRYNNLSPWEQGKPFYPGEFKGDPLTLYANRQLPFGSNASLFDDEGIPAQRVPLVCDNLVQAFSAGQRHAEYLAIPATGDFGDIEIPAGRHPASELLSEPYIEVVQFSWFHPDEISGDFSSEIRLGYQVENGQRTPFKGGQLVGNVLAALADVRWSQETGFYGSYQGPQVARFANLTIG